MAAKQLSLFWRPEETQVRQEQGQKETKGTNGPCWRFYIAKCWTCPELPKRDTSCAVRFKCGTCETCETPKDKHFDGRCEYVMAERREE